MRWCRRKGRRMRIEHRVPPPALAASREAQSAWGGPAPTAGAPHAADPVAMAAGAVPGGARIPARDPVPDVPRRDGGDDGAVDRPGVRAVGDPPPGRAEDRPAGARVRRADPPDQARHADDGRRADPDRRRRVDAAVVRLEQPLRLDRDAGDLRLRHHRLDRRLAQGGEEEPRGHAVGREVLLAVGDRADRGAVPGVQRLGNHQPARGRAVLPLGAPAASRTTCRPRPT